jgi:Nickel responsive protein SCO4226-like
VRKYLVERYLPGVTDGQLDEAGERLAAAAERLADDGVEVRYVGSTFVPEEESCFCRFESAGPDAVRRACEQAGVPFARIVETREFPPSKEER